MLSKEYRLTKDKELKTVFSSKKGVFDQACGIKIRSTDLPNSRFAFVVGTKVSKRAVDRNRIRRQYREIVRSFLPEVKGNQDVILLAGKASLNLSFEEKEQQLRRVFKKGGLL